MLAAVNGIQPCSVLAPTCTNFAGHRFSAIRSCVPTRIAHQPYTTAGIARAGSAIFHAALSAAARPSKRQRAIVNATSAPAATAANSGRVRHTRPAATPASTSRSRASASSIASTHSSPIVPELVCGSTKLKAVPEKPIASSTALARPAAQRRQPLPRQRVEGGHDRRRLHQAEGERRGETGAEELEAERQRVQPERAVVVAHVLVEHARRA